MPELFSGVFLDYLQRWTIESYDQANEGTRFGHYCHVIRVIADLHLQRLFFF